MEDVTFIDYPRDLQQSESYPAKEQRLIPISRGVLLSLIVFMLSFGLLFAGPALALRLMASSVEVAGPADQPAAPLSEVSAGPVITNVVLQQGRVPLVDGVPVGPPYAGTRDTYINKWKPTNNMGGEPRLMFGQSGAYRPLIYFDLAAASIPSNATIVDAQLGIWAYARNIFREAEAEVYQVRRHWEPLQATWYQATTGIAGQWATEGCDNTLSDRFAVPASTRTVFVREAFHYLDVASIVQDWVTTPANNEGFVLIGPDPAVIYYYRSTEWNTDVQRPVLSITWTITVPPTPPAAPSNLVATSASATQIDLTWTDNASDETGFKIERSPDGSTWAQIATVGANVTAYSDMGLAEITTYYYRVRAYSGAGNSAYSNVASAMTGGPGAIVTLDETSVCYAHDPAIGVWQTGTTGGYGGNYEYETDAVLTHWARWGPCLADPMPVDSMYRVEAHWSVHSARPQAVPYEIHYDGGVVTVHVDQTKNAVGATVPNFSESGWRSLGIFPFRAGTYTTTGEYVELNTSSTGDTCADAVRWVQLPGLPGPPQNVAISADPTELPSNGSAVSTIAVTVTDGYGNFVANGTMVGLTTSLGTLPYTYTEAEHAAVTKLGSWTTLANANASGGSYIRSNSFGDEATWTFRGEAVSLVYRTAVGGGVADVVVDGVYVATINFASGSTQWQVERQLTSALSPGLHTIRVRNGGVGPIWLDAFRSGTTTTGGVATASLVAPLLPGTATVRATALGSGLASFASVWPAAQTTVSFPGPAEVWVDDDYCSTCANDGHMWDYTAFDNIQDGVDEVLNGGIVHVLAGNYVGNVTVAKPVRLLGIGSDVVIVDGTDAPGSRGFYVDRADGVTISGFTIRDFERGIYLRGTGSGSGPRVYNATVTNNEFVSNNAGSNSWAIYGENVYTSTLCSNDITGGYHGIYLGEVYGTVVCYNDIYTNLGVGVKFNTGNDNSIDNNTIHENQDVGIELAGTTLRNGVYGNMLYDLAWDGVLVNGSGTSEVNIEANTIERTNLAWLNASSPPDANHNLGGISLVGVTNSSVYGNRVSDISNAGGMRPDAAGVSLLNNTAPITISRNLIQNCAGHGIHIPGGGGVANVHGNSIYSNGRFGLNNQLAANVHVEGNWWGCNTLAFGPAEPADIRNAGSAFWSPQISLTLSTTPAAITADGVETADVLATASGFGYNILDGTWITFTSDLSTLIFPTSTTFGGGQATAILQAGTIAGVATITGSAEPGRCAETVTITLEAGAPHSIEIDAHPDAIPNSCDTALDTSVVSATIRDVFGNGVPNVLVSFSSNALGSVSPAATTTMAGTGVATTTFSSGALTGTGVVTASAGVTLTTAVEIEVTAGPPVTGTVTADPGCPDTVAANGIDTSAITVTLEDCLGNPVPDGTMVGFTTSLGSIVNYEYVEAESSDILTSAGWSVVADATASGGARLQTSTPGAAAFWDFRGEAVSLIYRRWTSGGTMRVRVDGGTPLYIDTSGSGAWLERVIATDLNPVVMHQIEVVYDSGASTIRLDAFRSGNVTSGGIATAVLRAPALHIVNPTEIHTGTVYATSNLGHPMLPTVVVTDDVCFSQADIVWVDDDWAGLADGMPVMLPVIYGDGTATIGSDAFDTIPEGVAAVATGGTVRVLDGDYPFAVAGAPVVLTRTMNLLGEGGTSSIIIGTGSGNGIRVRPGADNSWIEGFIIRDFDYGVWMEGWSSNYLENVTFASNVITGSATGALTATYFSDGRLADNALYDNNGFGLDLDTGDNNQIVNNQIFENNGFGLRVFSSSDTSTGNVISYNQVHDVDGDGIRVADGCMSTQILGNTVHTTNRVSVPGFNSGGIVLRNTRDSTVEDNDVSNIGTASGSTDTAGIHVSGTDRNAVIQYNRILYNANDGIFLFNFNPSYPLVINCNHIYGNGRYGLRNVQGATPVVDATENWWGQNEPTRGTVPPKDIYRYSTPNNVDWNPPIQLTLTPAVSTVTVGGPAIVITAEACDTTCCILENTPITFTTNLGGLGSPPGPTVSDVMMGGQATVMFTPGTVAGTATITATLPNSGVVTTTITILPGPPASIDVEALPTTIEVGSGVSAIAALVVDIYGNLVLDGTVIDFSSSLGLLDPLSNATITGVVTSTLYAGTIPGFAVVQARWGFVVDSTIVEIVAGPPCTITAMIALPSAIPADGVSTSLIAVDVVDRFYNAVPDGSMVGFTTSHGSLIYGYAEAESAAVGKVGSWSTIASGSASGGQYIRTSTIGDTAGWPFRGQAVSLRYRTAPGYGRIEVRVDGGVVRVIDTDRPAGWVEEVMDTNLSATAPHSITVVALDAAFVGLDAFRSGAATTGGRAAATLTAPLLDLLNLPPPPAVITATGVGDCFPVYTTTVEFLQPDEVWVDDNYCSTCLNDGHIWGYDAFDIMPDGITAVTSGGTVHVLEGVYTLAVEITKTLYLDGAGSASTFMIGTDTGTGIHVTPTADGTIIEGFTIQDFALGLLVDGQSGNKLLGVGFTDSVIMGCPSGAISVTYVNQAVFADNTLHHNGAFGFDLDSGIDTLIQNNRIYDISGFGLRVASLAATSLDNVVFGNYVYDVEWDGIHIGPNSTNTEVLSNTVHSTNQVNSPGPFNHNHGGIVLDGTANSTVEYNHVSSVGTAGTSQNTAGVKVLGANSGGAIRYNRVLYNDNDGVLLWNYTGSNWPFVNCNHIYGNGRFGLRNNKTAIVDAEGNWWGHQPPPTWGSTPPKDIYRSGPMYVDWDPAMELTLTPAQPVIRAGFPAIAITLEGGGGGCCILNTTPVTFTTDLGGLGDPPGPSVVHSTGGCQAVAMFTPGGVVGTATITATVPNAGVVTTTVEIVAGLPYSMTLSATPPEIYPWGCRPPGEARQSTIAVTVADQFGNPNVGEPITWTLSPGLGASLQWTSGVLDVNGYHLTILDAGNIKGTAVVSATVVTLTHSISVEIMSGVPGGIALERAPAQIIADGVTTAAITATVGDECGNVAQDGTMVGFETDYGTLPHAYVEAESSQVISSTGEWTVEAYSGASGGHYLSTTVPGAQLHWDFNGSAVSVVYARSPTLGRAEVYVDGVFYKRIAMFAPFTQFQRETVAVTGLDPSVPHYVTVKAEVAPVFIDALRSGTETTNGIATAVLTSERQCATATITGTAVDHRIQHIENPPYDATTVLFQCADLFIDKTVQPPDRLRVGEKITFTIQYQNYASITAANTQITDVIKNGVLGPGWLRDTWFSTPPTVVVPEMHYRWSLGNLLPGEGGEIRFGGTVAENRYWPSATVITNTATISSSMVDPGILPNAVSVSTTILPGPPVTLSMLSSVRSIPVGGETTLLRVTGQDTYGNPLADGTRVTFMTDLGGFPQVQEAVRTASGGEARINLTSGTQAGTANVTASANPTVTIQIIFMPLGPYTITLTADPAEITVGGATATIEAVIVDRFGNPVADGTAVTFETSHGTIDPHTGNTVGGQASTVLRSGTQAVTATVTARAGLAVGTLDVRFVPGEPRVTINANPTVLSVGRNSMITVIARDEFGNHVLDGTVVSFTTSVGFFTDSLISVTFGSTIGGRADVLLTSHAVGTSIVRGAVGVDSAVVAVTWGPGEPHAIEITSVEPGLIPGCVGTALATAEVWDQFGNHVRNGTVVIFEVVPQVGSVEPIDGGRTTDGVAQAIISAGVTPIWANVFAFPQGYRSSVFDQYGIEFQVGPPDRIELAVEPPQLMVGGRNATVRTRALDCGGYPVTDGTLVTFTLTSGGGSLAPQTVSSANGWAISTLTSPDQTGTATVEVTAGERQTSMVVTYIPGPPFNIVLTADPLSIPANGVVTSTVAAEISDSYGNPVADGTAVVFSTDLGRFATGPSYSTIAVGGRASAMLIASNTPGIARVTAQAGGRSGEIYVDFYFEPTPTPPPTVLWRTHLPVILKFRYR